MLSLSPKQRRYTATNSDWHTSLTARWREERPRGLLGTRNDDGDDGDDDNNGLRELAATTKVTGTGNRLFLAAVNNGRPECTPERRSPRDGTTALGYERLRAERSSTGQDRDREHSPARFQPSDIPRWLRLEARPRGAARLRPTRAVSRFALRSAISVRWGKSVWKFACGTRSLFAEK